MTLEQFITEIPKAELHLHIEGTFEPELMFSIAQRNGVKIRYNTVEELRTAYDFSNLQEFLDLYYEGANVLLKEQDFYDLTRAYMQRIHADHVRHTEIFFDPQTHTERGIPFQVAFNGILKALQDSEREFGISYRIIMCFLRHLDEASAFRTLEQALPYKQHIIGVGLDSSENGHPPSKFKRVFEKALTEGFLTVAHAGEEGPATYIREALDLLHVSRIDHGNRCLDDDQLVDELAQRRIPLTLCPLSNLELQVVNPLSGHPVKKLLDRGVVATLNSDDPAYFGGYVNENYLAAAKAVGLTKDDIHVLARNSFDASFLSVEEKAVRISEVDAFWLANR